MKIEKKVLANLTKCYSIAPLKYQGKDFILVAAEKQDRCILFDMDGKEVDTLWNEPGGVMSMQQVPNSDGVFLATHKFYSQNDSSEAKIVIVRPISKGNWERKVLVELPFVHRFGILNRNGVNYLIACTIKSGHEYRDDWSKAGKVLACVLPSDLSSYGDEKQLELKVIKDDMLKNHGFYMIKKDDYDTALVACDNGVFRFTPPENEKGEWEIEELVDVPASDCTLVDVDNDKEDELVVIAPFHGDNISFYRKQNGKYTKFYDYGKKVEFVHSIFGGNVLGEPVVVIGHRRGEMDLILFRWNKEKGEIESTLIDSGKGSANVYKYEYNGREYLISTNRETDEIARYEFKK